MAVLILGDFSVFDNKWRWSVIVMVKQRASMTCLMLEKQPKTITFCRADY
jgi:hypothetical protein